MIVEVARFEKALLIESTEANEILSFIITTRHCNVMVALWRCLGKDKVVPVGFAARTVSKLVKHLVGIDLRATVYVVQVTLVIQRHRLISVEQLGHTLRRLYGVRTIIRELGLTSLTFLSGYQHHAIGRSQTVD